MRKYIIPILFCLTEISFASSFDALVDSVIDNNPSLKSSDLQMKSEIYDAKSENMLSAPEAEFEYLWGRHDAGYKLNAGITQEFDWPGIYSARNKAIKTKSRALQYLRASNEMEKRLEIKLLYIDIIHNKKNKAILQERMDIMDQLIEKYARGVALGQLSRIDLNKLKIENIRLKNSMTNLDSEAQVLRSSLDKLNGGKPCQNIIDLLNEYPDEIILPVEEYDRLLADADPMAKYSESLTESQRYYIKAEKMTRMPGFSLGYHHSVEGGEVFNGLSVGIKLPSFSSRNKIKAAEAVSESLLYEQDMIKVEKRAEMIANRNNSVELLKKYSEYKSVMKNDDSISQLQKSLDAGEISIIDYLAEMDFFMVAAQEMLQLEYDYMIAVTNLNKYKLLR